MAKQEKFNFHYAFQGIKYANGICNSHSIFYTVSAPENPSMHSPVDVQALELLHENVGSHSGFVLQKLSVLLISIRSGNKIQVQAGTI